MLSKKYNDSFFWKKKLKNLECLPNTFATDKAAMWNKLHQRLQEDKSVTKAIWYWIAATIIPFIIIALTMFSNDDNTFVQQSKHIERSKTAYPVLIPAASKEAVKLSVYPPDEKLQNIAVVKPHAKKKIIKDNLKADEIIVAAALPEKTEIELTVNNLPSVDTTLVIATTVIVKKKMQVVHINELESFPAGFTAPVNYTQNLADTKPKKSRPRNLNIAASQNSIGFKIKLSSKN
jgi:hypothetical protein